MLPRSTAPATLTPTDIDGPVWNQAADAIEGPVLNALSFGAVGDGVTDDTAAIQAAIDQAAVVPATGPGPTTVLLPRPIFRVVPVSAGARVFRIYPHVRVRGLGQGLTTLKLGAGVGTYKTVFSPNPTSTDCSGFELSDLTIDQNSAQNSTVAAVTTNPRVAVQIYAGTQLRVARVLFADVDAINTVDFSGVGIKDVRVEGCDFDVSGHATPHDYSAIYTDGDGAHIHANVLRGRTQGRTSIATGIETHGSHVTAIGNQVYDFQTGFNVVGSATSGGDDLVFQGNLCERVQIGFNLWSYAGMPLTNAVFIGNPIRLLHSAWNQWSLCGFNLEANGTAATRNVTIAHNPIRFVGAVGTISASDNAGAGIHWWRSDQSLVDESLHLLGNQIDGALAAGIRLATTVRDFTILNNSVRNPGLSAGGYANDYRAGLFLGGTTMSDGLIQGNGILDDQATSTIKYGIRNAATTCVNVKVFDNPLRVVDGTAILPYSQNGSQVVLLRASGTGSPENSIYAGIGSQWMREDGGANTSLYIKEANSGGKTGWVGK